MQEELTTTFSSCIISFMATETETETETETGEALSQLGRDYHAIQTAMGKLTGAVVEGDLDQLGRPKQAAEPTLEHDHVDPMEAMGEGYARFLALAGRRVVSSYPNFVSHRAERTVAPRGPVEPKV